MDARLVREAAGRLLAHRAAFRLGRPEESPYWPAVWPAAGGPDLAADAARVARAWLAGRRAESVVGPGEFPRLYTG
jgi:hypothetical protein